MASYDRDTSKLARDYDRLSDTQFQSGKDLVERMRIRQGASVLDVGCGTGRLAQWLALRVGPEGKVIGIDPLAERIAIARAQVPSVQFEIGYAEDLSTFADRSFEGVCMSAVFHWIQDKPKALAEAARVLCPGGQLGMTTLPKEFTMSSTLAELMVSVCSQPVYRGRIRREQSALAHQMSTFTEIIDMVVAAGLRLVELHAMERVQHWGTAGEVLDFVEASSFGNFLSGFPEGLHDNLRADFERAIAPHREPEGFALRDYGVALVARKPANRR